MRYAFTPDPDPPWASIIEPDPDPQDYGEEDLFGPEEEDEEEIDRHLEELFEDSITGGYEDYEPSCYDGTYSEE